MSQYRQTIDGVAIDSRQDPELMATLDQIHRGLHEPFFYCGRDDRGRLWVGPHARPSTREEMISSWQAIPCCTPTKDARGWSVMGEKRYLTLEEATDKVDRLYLDLIPTPCEQ